MLRILAIAIAIATPSVTSCLDRSHGSVRIRQQFRAVPAWLVPGHALESECVIHGLICLAAIAGLVEGLGLVLKGAGC